jgi:hypothetical protein
MAWFAVLNCSFLCAARMLPLCGCYAASVPTTDAAAGGSMLLERWTLCFNQGVNSSSSGRASMDTAAVYKRLVSL